MGEAFAHGQFLTLSSFFVRLIVPIAAVDPGAFCSDTQLVIQQVSTGDWTISETRKKPFEVRAIGRPANCRWRPLFQVTRLR